MSKQNITIDFPIAETLKGRIIRFEKAHKSGYIQTSNKEEFYFELGQNCSAELLRNLNEAYVDYTDSLLQRFATGPEVFAIGIFYPDSEKLLFEIHHVIFLGKQPEHFRFEEKKWWVDQIDAIGSFYLKAQFEGGKVDYKKFRTVLTLRGEKETYAIRQETNSFSRLIGGFATAYLLTGRESYLEAAEKGVEYFTDHLRFYDQDEELVYWYHGIDLPPGEKRETKIFASEYGDDFYAIAACEQIYALSGLVQTYRINGNPEILKNIELTIKLFDSYFIDKEKGGYFSHLDPVTLNPKSQSLGVNCAKKNWNSIGDHGPVYLISLWCATQEPRYKKMLEEICDIIIKYFIGKDHSNFVQERFYEDWKPDKSYLWQKDLAVIGHNLKIAWILTRVYGLFPKKEYLDCVQKILEKMAKVGRDAIRGGWYDVVERTIKPGEKFNRFSFHNRKAWWQQEQAILVCKLAAGILKNSYYFELARESSAFYNAFFLDHQDGGVYFSVQAGGTPYLMGTERYKGSRWMSACHSIELSFFSAAYSELFLFERPLELYFKPNPRGFKDRKLYVSPDIFPQKSIILDEVLVEGKSYSKFDAENLCVHLPDATHPLSIKVRLTRRK